MQSDRNWYSKYKLQASLALIILVLEPTMLNVRKETDGAEEDSATAREANDSHDAILAISPHMLRRVVLNKVLRVLEVRHGLCSQSEGTLVCA